MRDELPARRVVPAKTNSLRSNDLLTNEPTSSANCEAYDEAEQRYLGLGFRSRPEGTIGTGSGYGP